MRWWNVLWARPTSVFASVLLAVALASEWPLLWTATFSVFIVLHSLIGWVRQSYYLNRLRRNYDGILRRTLHLVSDLAELTGGRFDLWIVDLYLAKYSRHLSTHWPFVAEKKLVRGLSVTLTDVSKAPITIDLEHELFGSCFRRSESQLWWDINVSDLDGVTQNHWHQLHAHNNHKLRKVFGAMSVQPVVDSNGRKCRGLLVVHTINDPEIATKALSVLAQSKGRRRLARAREGIHSALS